MKGRLPNQQEPADQAASEQEFPVTAELLDEVLDQLEVVLSRMADGSAPLDDLVAAHEEASRLVDTAQASLRDLSRRLEEPPR